MENRNCPYCGKYINVCVDDVLYLTKYRIEKETKCPCCDRKVRYTTSTVLNIEKPLREEYDAC